MNTKTFGVMLDMSRNAVMNLKELKNYISVISRMGYNSLFLYTEDTYEVEGEPYFGYMRGRYSLSEMREIEEFALRVGVEIVPCIQTLAHLATIEKWHKYPMDTPDTLLVDEDATYELIDKMFSTLSKVFRSRKIHIGMDEAHNLGRGKHLDKFGYESVNDIMHRHLLRVLEIAKKHGYTPLIWSDMFFRPWNGGDYYFKGKKTVPKEYIEALPEGVVPVYWDYYFKNEEHYDDMLDAHSQLSDKTWFAGGAWTWGGFMPLNKHTLENSAPAIKQAKKHGIENIIITTWGDNGGECSRYAVLPSLFYISELVKGNEDIDLIKIRFKEMFGVDFDDLMLLDLPNDIAHPEVSDDPIYNPSKYMLYSDCFCGFLDSTVKAGGNSIYKKYAEELSKAKGRMKEYSYLLDTAEKLCGVLSDKYELGVKTRKAYKENDKSELSRLANEEYSRVEENLKSFKETFEAQWMKENKPFGFEVHEYRLGGLLSRISSCKKRLLRYASGEISDIPEFCEDILPFMASGESTYFNDFNKNFTSNVT